MRPAFVVSLLVLASCGVPVSETPPEPQPISLVFATRGLQRRAEDCGDAPDCAHVRLSWVEIAEAPPGVARDAIDRWVRTALLAPVLADRPPENPEALVDDFLAQSANFRSAPGGWFLERSIETLHHDGSVVSFRVSDSSFSGGAHPNASETYVSLYLTTGSPVTLEDLLVAGDRGRLLEVAETRFRQVRELGAEQDLGAAGFWFDRNGSGTDRGAGPVDRGDVIFALTDNFALTAEGLIFHYNAYDVAPYVMGSTTVEIPREALDGVVVWPG